MRISDLDKLPLYSPKSIDGLEGYSFKDPEDNKSIFISDTMTLTSLMSDYIGKFRFSKKSNRKIYLNKYVKTPKFIYTRNLIKTRSSFIKSQAILETDIKSSDCYDFTLENMSYRKAFGEIQAITRLHDKYTDDVFFNNKNINLFWLMSNHLTDSNITADESHIDKLSLMLMRVYKKHPLDPINNPNIKSIYLLFPYDVNDDPEIVDLRFYIIKVFCRDKEKEIMFSKLKAYIEKAFKNVESLQKKPLFTLNKRKESKDDNVNIDTTYEITTDLDEKAKEIHNSIKAIVNNAKHIDPKRIISDDKIPTKELPQLKEVAYNKLSETYMKESFNDDMKLMCHHAVNNFIPNVEVKDHKITDADDGITKQDLHTFTLYDNVNHIERNIEVLVPKIIDKKFFQIYDKKYILANQVYSNLVNKIKNDTVAFTSSHTKTIIYVQGKEDDRIGKYFSKNQLDVPYVNTYDVIENKNVPSSLHSIFKYSPVFEYKDYYISYDLYKSDYLLKNEDDQKHPIKHIVGLRKDLYPKKEILKNIDQLHSYIKDVYVKHGADAVIIYNTSTDSINNKPFLLEMKNELGKKDPFIKKMSIPGSSQYARMNISGKKIPVIIAMLIAYRSENINGRLEDFFSTYFEENVHIEVADKPLYMDNVISIELKDKVLNVFLYESLVASELLFSVLRKINMKKYTISDLSNNNDIYLLLVSYFETQKYQADTAINSVAAGLNSIVDPLTKEMIAKTDYEYPLGNKLVKPRNIIQILYYCVYLLNDRTFKVGNDFSGYRIRNMESIPAILYKLLSDKASLAKKESDSKIKSRRKAINAISIQKNELLEEFRNLTTFESFSDLNISNEIGLTSKATYKGFGGMNNNRSISYDLRATDPSAIGYIDIGNNVDNLNVGSNRMMPLSPNMSDTFGIDVKNKELQRKVMSNARLTDDETASLLSADVYEPFIATNADAPRISMCSIQARHGIPLSSYDDLPIKTGIEEALKHSASSSFVIKPPANTDDKQFTVIEINNDKQIISLRGNTSKKIYNVSFKNKIVNNSGGGFHLMKEFDPCVKVNQVVSESSAIALDRGSFRNNNYTNAKLMRTALFNYGETLEDGAIVSESAAKELKFNYVTEKSILIRNDQTIIKMIDKINTEVSVGTPLLIFNRADKEEDIGGINSFLQSLNDSFEENEGVGLNSYIKSKYAGTIVDIKITYNGEKLRDINALNKAIKNIPSENIVKINSNRMNGEIVENGIVITYYILSIIPALSGSKSTAQSTKSVFVVWSDDKMPKTLDGKRIDYVFSPMSIISRMTINNFTNLYLNKCIMELREQLKKDIK